MKKKNLIIIGKRSFIGSNIRNINTEDKTILFFDKDNRLIYNKDELLIVLTTTLAKAPGAKKKTEFYYDKKTNIVYSKLELIDNNCLKKVGIVENVGEKRKIKFD